jgi:hydroxymethylpyrimidine pyrophosphatase-like HAD family hydrolase
MMTMKFQSNKEMLAKVKEMGVLVILASGRTQQQ